MKLADEKMKPCPFCGVMPNAETWHGGKPTKHMVSCCNDECSCAPQCTGQTHEEAIHRWNLRAAHLAALAEIKALRAGNQMMRQTILNSGMNETVLNTSIDTAIKGAGND